MKIQLSIKYDRKKRVPVRVCMWVSATLCSTLQRLKSAHNIVHATKESHIQQRKENKMLKIDADGSTNDDEYIKKSELNE